MSVPSAVIWLASILSALGVITLFLSRIYRAAKRIDAALGVDSQGRTLSDRMTRVEHQLFPNGGGSLPDRITTLERQQAEQRVELRVVRDLLTTLVERD